MHEPQLKALFLPPHILHGDKPDLPPDIDLIISINLRASCLVIHANSKRHTSHPYHAKHKRPLWSE